MKAHRDVMADAFALGAGAQDEAPDVMGGLSNLADCMLVLVCGLMVAFFLHWNIGVTSPDYQEIQTTGEMVDLDDTPAGEVDAQSDDKGAYEKLGTVYKDVESGKMYYLLDEDGE